MRPRLSASVGRTDMKLARTPGASTRGVLELDPATFESAGMPTDEDLLLNVSVEVGGFAAGDPNWVVATDRERVMGELRRWSATGKALRHSSAPLPMSYGSSSSPRIVSAIGRCGTRSVGERWTDLNCCCSSGSRLSRTSCPGCFGNSKLSGGRPRRAVQPPVAAAGAA